MTEVSPKASADTKAAPSGFSAPNNILIATDFSDVSKDAIHWVLEHLLKPDLSEEQQRIHIYSALIEPVIVDPELMAFTLEDEETKRNLYMAAQTSLEDLLNQCKERLGLLGKKAAVSGSLEFAPGPGEAVVEKAKEMKPDLVVVGSHSKGNITGLFLGSVSSHVLTHCEYPVIIMRAGKFQKSHVI
ncbi:hypothetical protein DFJ74DRAFT_679784 [Hyaloraphidium curvatum]|nr:hypothetical protein DFJ74DRAFT_679784 [Hyaloraphidium curvatum]